MGQRTDDRTPESLRELLGDMVVIDTDSPYLILGRLESADGQFLKLSAVDVHEITRASLSKERYAHEAGQIGVRPNRKYTWVNMQRVIGLARLKDMENF